MTQEKPDHNPGTITNALDCAEKAIAMLDQETSGLETALEPVCRCEGKDPKRAQPAAPEDGPANCAVSNSIQDLYGSIAYHTRRLACLRESLEI